MQVYTRLYHCSFILHHTFNPGLRSDPSTPRRCTRFFEFPSKAQHSEHTHTHRFMRAQLPAVWACESSHAFVLVCSRQVGSYTPITAAAMSDMKMQVHWSNRGIVRHFAAWSTLFPGVDSSTVVPRVGLPFVRSYQANVMQYTTYINTLFCAKRCHNP